MFRRTKIYSVYVKKGSSNPLENAVLVPEGFNLWAFIFTYVWAAFNRVWRLFFIFVAIAAFKAFFDDGESIGFIMAILFLQIWCSIEANNFRSRSYERKGYILFDIVTGIDEIDAERRFFDKYLLSQNQLKAAQA